MTAEERERVHVRMIEWVHMTPQQRTQARINFQQSRDVSKEERQARWQAYQALPEERKRELARRAAPASAASAAIAGQPRVPTPLDEVRPKSNLVRAAGTSPANGGTASAMAVQARPGATTTLLTTPTHPPSHQQTGQPKIAGGPGDVDDATLLPKRGPQGAPLQLPRKPTASPPKPPAAPVVLPASGANPPAASPSAPAPLPAATASRP